MNPLDWDGADFLSLYIPLAAATLLLIGLWRSHLGAAPSRIDPAGLDAMHLGYLAGGPTRALDTALVGLLESGAAVHDRRRGVVTVDPACPVPPPFQPFRHVTLGETGRQDFHRQFEVRVARIRTELAQRGLVPSPAETARFRTGAFALLAMTLAFGLAKLAVGLGRGRPVGFLAIALIVALICGVAVIVSMPSRNRAGAALLRRVQQDQARAVRAPVSSEMAFAFALAGSAVLAGRTYRGFLSQGSGSSSDAGSSSGSDGGDGGDGGCGGCSA